jgi:hypothetical protein
MNHPCYKCGYSIEDGRAFCPQCGAPQIRVMIPEAPVPVVVEGVVSTLDRDSTTDPILHPDPANALSGTSSYRLKSCALSSAVAIVLTFVGLNPFVGALAAGGLAIAFFRRRGLEPSLRPAVGARLGAISGLFFFAMSTIFETLAVVLLHKGAELRAEMLSKIQQVSAKYPGPQVQPFLDFVKTPDGFAFMMVGSVIFGLVLFVALGSLGGAITASFLGRRDRP